MCSNDSPSVKPDGTTDVATLTDDYEEFLLDVQEQPLPSYRAEEIRVRIEEVRATLGVEGAASAGQLQQLLRVVTEALADVRAARVVAAPPDRDLSEAVPGAADTGSAYEVTETEQRKSLNVLIDLLFTVVETPTREDRRRVTADARDARDARSGDGSGGARDTDDSDGDAADGGTDSHLGVEGYAGPE